ncbi:hypothetical protein BASA83_011452 [Batrachochytrium salamandrivorans]|nr:hypothetical protein BASA83_011452 [Batrachochytrium salamandrivorans]
MIVRSLLVNELKDTHSVMYELRGNSGGLERDQGLARGRGRQSLSPMFFSLTTMESANTLGQAYLRPMGVFNDGRCYSSCEVFSGAIQGHGAGTIFGEDGRTGGGGSIVMELDPFLIRASPTYFKKFPFTQELTSGSITYTNTLTVSVTQTIRTGRYSGQTIEDVGIEPDTVFRPQWSDLQPDSPTNTQYDRIAASLARTGQENGQSKLHFVCEPFEIENSTGKFSLKVEAAGIEEFTVFQADGKTVIAKKRRSRATTKQKFSISVSAAGNALGNNRITIVGKTAGVQMLKTNRNVRTIPTNDKYMKIRNHMFIFSGSILPLRLFFTAPIGTKINIGLNVALDTEPGCDFLYLSVKSSGGVEDFLIRSKSHDGKKTFNGISGRKGFSENPFPSLQSPKVVMGKAYYGLELVDGNKSHLAPLQTTINKGIRLFTGARLSTVIGPLLVETGIGSLLTRSLVSRVRLLERSVTKEHPLMPSALQLLSTSIAHLVVECEQVTGHRIQSGLVPAIQKSRLRLLGRALDPGVENVYTWLRGGVLNGEADLDQRWLDGTVEHESMGTRHDNRMLGSNG